VLPTFAEPPGAGHGGHRRPPVLDSTYPVSHMGNVEDIARQIEALSPEERAQFRAWFQEFDLAGADPQLEADIQAGKVDPLVQDVLRDKTGKAKPL